jgi:uncharacterized UBP type Zn finger protein
MNKYIKNLPININTSISQPVYFFCNNLIDNNIYLCQQSNSIQNALFIIDVWNKYHYNIGNIDSYKSENDKKIQNDINIEELAKKLKNDNSFNLSKQEYNKSDYNYYIYVSDEDIREKEIGKGDNNYKIIIYKKDNVLHYLALLLYKKKEKGMYQIRENEEKKSDEENEEESEEENEEQQIIPVCDFTGLKYTGNSCYQDSVLLSLFAIPNKFIESNILEKDLNKIKESQKEIICSNDTKEDIKSKEEIQKELNKITNSIRNKGEKVEYCSMLRSLIKKCPSTSGQKFYETGTQDAGEFIQYLFSIFNVEGMSKSTKTILSNNLDENINEDSDNTVLSSYRMFNTSPIILIPSQKIIDSKITYYLDQYEDAMFDEKNLYRHSDGKSYKRRIEITNVNNTDYLIFYAQRLSLRESSSVKRNYNKIIPDETITLENNKKLSLHAIVVHKSLHYTCYIKCKNYWFYYNDKSNKIDYVGSYKDMIENKDNRTDPCKEGTLYFYS